jgi:hypothetical protein
MPAEKGADELTIAGLVLRMLSAGLASATLQVRGADQPLADGLCPRSGFDKTGGHGELLGRPGKQSSATAALRYPVPSVRPSAESGN